MWKLEEACDFIRSIQLDAWRNGYFLALAGGVLNRGVSDKDLDIVCAPASGAVQNLEELLKRLQWLGYEAAKPPVTLPGNSLYKLRKGAKSIDLIVFEIPTQERPQFLLDRNDITNGGFFSWDS